MLTDQILFWNQVSLDANKQSHTDKKDTGTLGPTHSARALAIVHLAMYDAFAGINGKPTYQNLSAQSPPAATPTATAAAIAAAAHSTLNALFPSQKPTFDIKLLEAGLSGADINAGHDYGQFVARLLLEDRKNDPDSTGDGYTPALGRGGHRVDPDNPNQGFYAPFYGAVARPLASTIRHKLAPPPQPGTADYKKALSEVYRLGIAPELSDTLPSAYVKRSRDESLVGIYWGYDGAANLGTPPRLYNQIVRAVAAKQGNDLEANARLFALVNVAMADAGIFAWEQKYVHNFWRPVVGIRENVSSLGPSAIPGHELGDDCDPFWLPLGAPHSNAEGKNFTPNFPAYPSGHATFGAAAFHITRLFYKVPKKNFAKDKLLDGIPIVSDEFNGVTTDNRRTVRPKHARDFKDGLWGAIVENGRSRVFLGVHWIFDAFKPDQNNNPMLSDDPAKKFGGVQLGVDIAEDIWTHGNEYGPVRP